MQLATAGVNVGPLIFRCGMSRYRIYMVGPAPAVGVLLLVNVAPEPLGPGTFVRYSCGLENMPASEDLVLGWDFSEQGIHDILRSGHCAGSTHWECRVC